MALNLITQVELRLFQAKKEDRYAAALDLYLVPVLQKLDGADSELQEAITNVLNGVKMNAQTDRTYLPKQKLLDLHRQFISNNNPLQAVTLDLLQLIDLTPVNLLEGISVNSIQVNSFLNSIAVYGTEDLIECFSHPVPEKLERDFQKTRVLFPQLFSYKQKELSPDIYPQFIPINVRESVSTLALALPQIYGSVLVAALGDPLDAIKNKVRGAIKDVDKVDYSQLIKYMRFGSLEMLKTSMKICLKMRHPIPDDLIRSGFQTKDVGLLKTSIEALERKMEDNTLEETQKFGFSQLLKDFLTLSAASPGQVSGALKEQCYQLLVQLDSSKTTVQFLLTVNDFSSTGAIQKSLKLIKDGLDAETLLQRMRTSNSTRDRLLLLAIAENCTNVAAKTVVALYAFEDEGTAHDATNFLKLAPKFYDLFPLILEESKHFRKYMSPNVIESFSLFLFFVFVGKTGISYGWQDKLKLELKNPVQFKFKNESRYVLQFTKLVLSLIQFELCLDTLQLLLRVFLLNLSRSQQQSLDCDLYEYLSKTRDDQQPFREFISEYGPLMTEKRIEGSTKFHYRAQIVSNVLELPIKYDLSDKSELLDNKCREVLAVTGHFENQAENALPAKPSFYDACISLTSSIEQRKALIDVLLQDCPISELVATGENLSVSSCGWKSLTLQERYPQLSLFAKHSMYDCLELEEYCVEKITSNIKNDFDRRAAAVRLDCLASGVDESFFLRIQACLLEVLGKIKEVDERVLKTISKVYFRASSSRGQLLNSLIKTNIGKYAYLLDLAKECGDLSFVYSFFDPENVDVPESCIPFIFKRLFMPNEQVRTRMEAIYKCIPRTSVKSHLPKITYELDKCLRSNDAAVRDSAAVGYAELVDSKLLSASSELWRIAFHLSEINNRVASMKLGQALSRASSQTDESIDFIVSIVDIYPPAIEALLKFSKSDVRDKGGMLLESFILHLSDSEHPELNKLSVILNNEQIEDIRSKALRQSPVYTACESLIEEKKVEYVWMWLATALRKSVGLPSKIAVAQLTLFVASTQATTKPFGKELKTLMVNEVFRSNKTISTAFAIALGSASVCMQPAAQMEYANTLRTRFFDFDKIEAVATCIRHLHPDAFENVQQLLVPVVRIGLLADADKFESLGEGYTASAAETLDYCKELIETSNSLRLKKAAKEVQAQFKNI